MKVEPMNERNLEELARVAGLKLSRNRARKLLPAFQALQSSIRKLEELDLPGTEPAPTFSATKTD